MNAIVSQASKTDAHNVDDSRERMTIKRQIQPVYRNDYERRIANGKAREQQARFKNGR